MVGGLLSRQRAVNTATCSSQINRTPVFLPLLLDCLFSVEKKQKSFAPPLTSSPPDTRNQGKENVGRLTKMCFISACYFVLVILRVVFLVVGPKQSNQIAFVCDASQCSHSAHTMGKFISLRQQGCQCNLWVCWSESSLRAVQLGMLMGFGWGTELSGCCLTSAEKLSSSFLQPTTWTGPIWSLKMKLPLYPKDVICRGCFYVLEHLWCFISVVFCTTLPRNHLLKVKAWVAQWHGFILDFKLMTFKFPGFWSVQLSNLLPISSGSLETQTHHFRGAKRFFLGSGKSV